MTQSTDDRIRHEAALSYANGETRKAIGALITRINETNGHCSPQIWLCVLDLYQVEKQQAAYEKLAVFFSNRFHYSPPAWKESPDFPNKQTGQWRNALVVEGSPLDIQDEKIRDFIRASKEARESRVDLSRVRMDSMDAVAEQEARKLLSIMEKLRRIRCPTLLMGDAELVRFLRNKTKAQRQEEPKEDPSEELNAFWLLLFELLQWRGMEEEFDSLALLFAETYNYCPVGYDPSLALAKVPSSQKQPAKEMQESQQDDEYPVGGKGLELADVVLDSQEMCQWAQRQWDDHLVAEFSFEKVVRMGVEACQEFTHLVQAQSHPDGIDIKDTVLYDVSEIIASLFEVTGLVALATIQHRYEKLRHLLEV